jgi:hypothetical protein
MRSLQRIPDSPRRALRRMLLPALATLALAAPTPAQAALDLNAAVGTAKSVFPSVTQRCGIVGIAIGPLSALNVGASAESYFASCRVRIAPATMQTATQAQICSLMVHEWGHLAGLEHSADPNHFMSARVPHNPVCGPSDQQLQSHRLAEAGRLLRAEEIRERIADLRGELRATRKAQRRNRGATRARLAKKAKRLEKRIKRLRAELRSL